MKGTISSAHPLTHLGKSSKRNQEEQRVFCAKGSVGDADAEAHTRQPSRRTREMSL